MAVSREEVQELSELLDLFHYIQPVNGGEERERFEDAVAERESYNPTYRYPVFEYSGKARELLDSIRASAETVLEERMVESLESRLEMIEAVGSSAITETSRQHYGSPSKELIEEARKRFESGGSEDEKTVDAALLKESFDTLFDELGVSYECGLADVDIIRNSPLDRRILMPRGKEYTVTAAERLLVHESTHSMRTVNGIDSGSPPLVHGTRGYETAEEGLATFNEEKMEVFQDSLPRITARVVAVAAAGESFHGLYRAMRELGLGERASYVRAYRVKRGLEDTSRPGGFIKDHIYYQGYVLISENPETAEKLYAGKIGLEDLDSVETSPRVSRQEHLQACRETLEKALR